MHGATSTRVWLRLVLGVVAACSFGVSCDGGGEPPGGDEDLVDGATPAADGEAAPGAEGAPDEGSIAFAQAAPGGVVDTPTAESEDLRRRLVAGEVVDALVVLDEGPIEAELQALSGRADRSEDGPELVALRSKRLREVSQRATYAAMKLDGFSVRRTWDHLPIVAVRLAGVAALDALAGPEVVVVEPERQYQPSLAQSLPLIGQPSVQGSGMRGEGTTVAVLDTGVKYTLSSFGSCTAPGVPASCKVAYAQDFAPNDGLLDDTLGHGTNVAAIVVGVAPLSKIAALDVFSGSSASSTHILSAVNWVIANKAKYNIVAMNLSLGAGSFTSPCPSDTLATAVASARSAGVLAAVATGNDAYTNAVSTPACGPASISVGAVYDSALPPMSFGRCSEYSAAADKVACFSNSASFITMVAPGAMIEAGGKTMAGTSMAAPHVAGALAVLRGAYPSETPDQVLLRLTSTGKPVKDWRNGITKPRLDLAAAAASCVTSATLAGGTLPETAGGGTIQVSAAAGCQWQAQSGASWLVLTSGTPGAGSGALAFTVSKNLGLARSTTVTVDGLELTVAQAASTITPSITLNGGAAVTASAAVSVAVADGDPAAFPTMCVSNGASCTAFQALAQSASWTLSSGDGPKTVNAWFRRPDGSTVGPMSDGILLDATAPTNGTLFISSGDGFNALSWSGFSDSGSGVVSYRARWAVGAPPASCAAGTLLTEGSGTTKQHTGLLNGTPIGYRVCAIDAAGNVSTGTVAMGTPVPETAPPIGSMSIDGGKQWTGTTAVTLAIAATDQSGVAQMCVSNTTTCAAWAPFAAIAPWTLTPGTGLKTVRVWLRDIYLNTTPTPLTATIALDATDPFDGEVSSETGSGYIALSFAGFGDADSGLAGYRVVGGTTAAAPASCTGGTLLYSGAAPGFTHSGLANGATYTYRVCAVDVAGRSSAGVALSVALESETIPPKGTVTFVGCPTLVAGLSVTLALEANDASGVAEMCISNTPACTAWQAFEPMAAWELEPGWGARTVYVWYADVFGNVSASPATATIYTDALAPVDGVLTATPSGGAIRLDWSGFKDGHSGLAGFTLFASPNGPPASCGGGTVLHRGGGHTFLHSGLTHGSNWGYRLCAFDVARNVSTGAVASATAH